MYCGTKTFVLYLSARRAIHMNLSKTFFVVFTSFLIGILQTSAQRPVELVKPMMGTSNNGFVVPVAAAPFGMVELGPDTFFSGPGYLYNHSKIYGFSHTHKSGMGGTDFQDIMFFPISDPDWLGEKECNSRVSSSYNHDKEYAEPGYYKVSLLDSNIEVELTATARCGMHRYQYPQEKGRQVMIDLKHGSEHSCTIIPEEDFDTVKVSRIEFVDEYTVKGFRISNRFFIRDYHNLRKTSTE